ncbi:hypothetical protein HG536_0H04640 [Torulaspora globosa]|uniref:U three protein 23 n=1 Tax=Torulaspora globosa TaxID=48254 RepID=A0A7G3ZNK2_9SACH|nr:uncharacterized protein HG536_0H04640 [Torulaspora globosa]QLL35088.1 hypothetical protein HG536_0H04640 [Torulaspora globosa]
MRQKRAKAYRKQMLVYNHTFKFREPYQVLIDDQIVLDCHGSTFDLVKGLKRTLQAEVKVMITQCCMQSLYETNNQGAIDLAKTFERRRCNHPPKEPKPPKECIESVVNVNGQNKHRYVVATQDIDIRRSLRRTPGVPLVYTSRSVMVMEPLSDASSKVSKAVEEDKLFKGLNDPRNASLKAKEDASKDNQQETTRKRPRGPKQPNPLSVKKKKSIKPSSADQSAETGSGDATKSSKRRRKHKSGTTRAQPSVERADDATSSS